VRSEIPRVVGVTNVMGAAARCCSVATEDDLASRCPGDQVTFPKMNVPFNPEGNKRDGCRVSNSYSSLSIVQSVKAFFGFALATSCSSGGSELIGMGIPFRNTLENGLLSSISFVENSVSK
jgi:hypothetical protein